MATTLKKLMDAANAAVPRITPAQAREMIAQGNTLVLDVREPPEVEKTGKVASAVNVSRSFFRISRRSRVAFARQEFCQGQERDRLLCFRRPRRLER